MVRAYHQIQSPLKTWRKSASTKTFGVFEFQRMAFGLGDAIQTFRRLISSNTRDMGIVHVYIDDLLVALPKVDEHKQHVTLLFQGLSENRHGVTSAKRN